MRTEAKPDSFKSIFSAPKVSKIEAAEKIDSSKLKQVLFRLDSEAHQKIKMLAVRQEISVQDLIIDALADYCEKHSVRIR